MLLIPDWVLALAFLFSAIAMLYRRKWEHALTRLLIASFYFYLFSHTATPVEIARLLARWFFLLLAIVEIVSFFILFPFLRDIHAKHDNR